MNIRQIIGGISAALFTTGVAAVIASLNNSVSPSARSNLMIAGAIAVGSGIVLWVSLFISAKSERVLGSAPPQIHVSGGAGGAATAGKDGVAIAGNGGDAQVGLKDNQVG